MERSLLILAVSALMLILDGCASSYQPYQGLKGGFFETQLDANAYRVEYSGSFGSTVPEVSQLLLYRCAELTLQKGYDSFVVVFGYNRVQGVALAAAVITMFIGVGPSNDSSAYDARKILGGVGKNLDVPIHEIVTSGANAFDTGSVTDAANYPHSEVQIDANTFRLEIEASGYAGMPKLVDHALLYRCAELTIKRGGDYFVIVSGHSQYIQEYYPMFSYAPRPPYYNRSVIIRLFKGPKPTQYSSAFMAKAIIENIQIELPRTRQKIDTVTEAQWTDMSDTFVRKRINPTGVVNGKEFQMRISGPFSKKQLELRLLRQCAELTIDEGQDYFVIDRESSKSTEDVESADPDNVTRYDGNGATFRGFEGRDGRQHDARVDIQLFTGTQRVDNLSAYDAKEVLRFTSTGPSLR